MVSFDDGASSETTVGCGVSTACSVAGVSSVTVFALMSDCALSKMLVDMSAMASLSNGNFCFLRNVSSFPDERLCLYDH
ncbi:hypothetical protein [Streptococcus pyogenes NS88.2]|nr:hypothetical protein [Streptococcus pyogenes NS88.2]